MLNVAWQGEEGVLAKRSKLVAETRFKKRVPILVYLRRRKNFSARVPPLRIVLTRPCRVSASNTFSSRDLRISVSGARTSGQLD